ncbi:MAG TPA: flagellar hook-length control protein FliK [Acidobacteriaceae bacterium]|nr:flagellar hook-length control protein FliK [Acidobacteriaceae bacterium]
MHVASAISTHSVQASHHPAAKGIGVRGQGRWPENGSGSAPDFGEVLRGQAGVVSQPGLPGATAKQGPVPVSGQVKELCPEEASGKGAAKISEQTKGAANQIADQIKEVVKAKTAAQMDSPFAQLPALSKDGAKAADAKSLQVAANAADSKTIKKDDNLKVALPGTDAGDGKAVKAKSGKGGKADKTTAAQTSADKPPQVPVQAAIIAASAAAAPVSAPVLPLLEKSAKAESAAPPRAANAAVPVAKSVSGKQVPQAAKETAEKTGKIQENINSAALPMPNASPAPEGAQVMAGDLTGDADSAEIPEMKRAGKQDPAASAAKAGSEVVPQTKHSPVPPAVHSAHVAQTLVAGPGEAAAHIPASPQNFAGVSSPAVGAAHGAGASGASPYDRIDQGTAPVVLHAGAQHVAVGVHDPSLGWVEIKTQSTAGHVDATLVASSGQTHDALAAQLPAISQFLEQRDVRVGTLVVNHQSAGSGANHFGNGSGQHAGPGYGGNSGSGGNGGSNGSQRHAPRYNAPAPARHSVPMTGAGGESSARPLSYISVRA